jgi:hypothetical protein
VLPRPFGSPIGGRGSEGERPPGGSGRPARASCCGDHRSQFGRRNARIGRRERFCRSYRREDPRHAGRSAAAAQGNRGQGLRRAGVPPWVAAAALNGNALTLVRGTIVRASPVGALPCYDDPPSAGPASR